MDDALALLAQTARQVAAAATPAETLAVVLGAIRRALGASGAALLRVERGRLVPAAADDMEVVELDLRDAEGLQPRGGGGYPLVLAGRLEGVLLLDGVAQPLLAEREEDLAALLDLAAVALRSARLVQEREAEAQERELRMLERLPNPSSAPGAGRARASRPLRDAHPALFEELVATYCRLLDMALERQAFKVEHPVSDGLRTIADRLGAIRAGPRDAVAVHTSAIRRLSADAPQARARAYVEEGRVRLLELMGNLVTHYRGSDTLHPA